jgi:hypothetical protein
MSNSPAPAILRLRDQIDAAFPNRNKSYDGIMGDAAHQARQSDHNEGNAIDITLDVANGPDLPSLREALMKDPRTVYVIFNHQIESTKIQPGVLRPYTKVGGDPHEHHLHLSIDPARRDDTSSWNLSGVTSSTGVVVSTPYVPSFAPSSKSPKFELPRKSGKSSSPWSGVLLVLGAGAVLYSAISFLRSRSDEDLEE